MAIHLGPVLERDGDYFGMPPNMAARLRDAGHGSQILLSAAAVQEVEDQVPDDVRLVSLGVHRLRGIPGEHGIYEVLHPDLPQRFPRSAPWTRPPRWRYPPPASADETRSSPR
jgi:class 3 adenylate cyclase